MLRYTYRQRLWGRKLRSKRSRANPRPQGERVGGRAASQILAADIDRAVLADQREVAVEPRLRPLAAYLMQVQQELPIGVELRCDAKALHHVLGVDGVDAHAL